MKPFDKNSFFRTKSDVFLHTNEKNIGTLKNDKTTYISTVDRIHIKSSCFTRNIVKSAKKLPLYSFELDAAPECKMKKTLTGKLLKHLMNLQI